MVTERCGRQFGDRFEVSRLERTYPELVGGGAGGHR